jgi:hypothetical protein
MADYYFDSSAVVKKYVIETGTAWVFKLIKPSSFNTIYVSRRTAIAGLAVEDPNAHP